MIVTKVTVQKANKERFNIFLDEQYAFSVDQNIFIQYGLMKGKELDTKDIENILHTDIKRKAYNIAIVFLSYRMRSEKEIRIKLHHKEMPDEIIDDVIKKLKQDNYVNDEQFADAFIKTNIKTTAKGPTVLKRELREKGVHLSHIEKAMEQYTLDEQIEKAQKIMGKSSKKTVSAKQNSSAMEQLLYRKGFESQVIQAIRTDEQDEEQEWNALLIQGEKLQRRYEKYPAHEYKQKMKQALYRKGFVIELINQFLAMEKE